MSDKPTIAVVGAGALGRALVQRAAAAGHGVLLFDIKAAEVEQAVQAVGTDLRRAADTGELAPAVADAAIARIRGVPKLDALAVADFVVEAVAEDLEVKKALFATLDSFVREEVILATTTAALSVAAIAAACRRPERVAGLHVLTPLAGARLVEIVRAPRTDPGLLPHLTAFADSLGLAAIVVEDVPGFVVDHAVRGFLAEALRLYDERVAAPAVLDAAARAALGLRAGPFELADTIGLDAVWKVQRALYTQLYHEPRLRPVPSAAARVSAGLNGRKAGQGFYRYVNNQPVLPEREPVSTGLRRPLWISTARPAFAKRVVTALRGSGDLVAGAAPPPGAVVLVTPLGQDATTAAVAEKRDPAWTVAVDALFPIERHATLMPTPATHPDAVAAVAASFAACGRDTAVIDDSPGFVAQRLAFMLVAIAADLAAHAVAEPAAIDLAVASALGLPQGPLALGDRIGPRVVVEGLERLRVASADPRWRVPPWLARRAQLGLALSSAPPQVL